MDNRMTLPEDRDAKELLCEIGRRMYAKDFCMATDGNLSLKSADGNIWMSPSGAAKGFMTPDILVKVDMAGNQIDGPENQKASSEKWMHLNVYRERPDVNGVLHAHSPLSTAFACARMDMTAPVATESILTLGDVLCAPFQVPGTQELADSVLPYLQGHAACLLANHGVVTWGKTILEAFHRLESVEYYAKMLILAGIRPEPVHLLDDEERAAVDAQRIKYGITF